MPTIFDASESRILVDGKPIEGVRSIEYRQAQVRNNVYALGSVERIGLISGPQTVEGRIKVASTSSQINQLTGSKPFQLIAQLKQGETKMTVSFDECYLLEKSFDMSVGGHGETIYNFTATRVREEA